MKNYKLIILSLFLALFTLTSCDNEEQVVDNNPTATKSESARTSMQELSNHFNNDGSLRNSNNPTGNILFDFCFDLEYPVTFSYNTGTTVVVDSFEDLLSILLNMTDELYIDGVEFPFNVTVYNNNGVETQTISNELEFVTLIDSCGFEDECACTEQYEPVCVEVDYNGDSVIMEFPNMCYAACEGFTQQDVVECEDNTGPGHGNDFNHNFCWDIAYPVSFNVEGDTVVVENDAEWDLLMYTAMQFELVYPYNITLVADGSTVAISTEEDLTNVILTCSGQTDECEITNFIAVVGECSEDGTTYSVLFNFEVENPTSNEFDIVFEMDTQSNGTYNLSDLPLILEINVNDLREDWANVSFESSNCSANISMAQPDCGTTACEMTNFTAVVGDCNDDDTYTVTFDFDVENPDFQEFTFFLEVNPQLNATYLLSDLPITLDVPSNIISSQDWASVFLGNSCSSSIEFTSPGCDRVDCWEYVFPVTINYDGVDTTVNNSNDLRILLSDDASSIEFVYPSSIVADGATVTINTPNDFFTIGEWNNYCQQ